MEEERGIGTAEVEGAELRACGGSDWPLSIFDIGGWAGTNCWERGEPPFFKPALNTTSACLQSQNL